jgi:hypothetical protein
MSGYLYVRKWERVLLGESRMVMGQMSVPGWLWWVFMGWEMESDPWYWYVMRGILQGRSRKMMAN